MNAPPSATDPVALGQLHGRWLTDRILKAIKRFGHAVAAETDAMRLYDRDIPELPLTIDRYADHLHVAIWSRGHERDPAGRWRRLQTAVAALAERLDIAPTSLHWKERAPQGRDRQYQPHHEVSTTLWVREGPARLQVELDRYLDTGLFLDHRIARADVRAAAGGLDVLNLFSYTGAFSVHAGLGGARHTTSVDLSRTYCAWADANWHANGLAGDRHEVVVADVRGFLDAAIDGGRRWDLIVCDPPSFSRSKSTAVTFDVQRDQGGLLRRMRAVLAPRGRLLFSTNHHGFRPDPDAFGNWIGEEVSARTVPPEFRDRAAHRAWWLAPAGFTG